MKFYVINNNQGEVVGCEFSEEKARREGKALHPEGGSIDRVTITTTSPREVIRRLLGQLGGYADDTRCIYEWPRPRGESTTEVNDDV